MRIKTDNAQRPRNDLLSEINCSRMSLLALNAVSQRFRNIVSTQIVMSISNGAATNQAVSTQAET